MSKPKHKHCLCELTKISDNQDSTDNIYKVCCTCSELVFLESYPWRSR